MLSIEHSSPIPRAHPLTHPREAQIHALAREYPLPASVSFPEIFVDAVDAAGELVHSCGLSSEHICGRTVTGAAAELDSTPYARGYFELLERAAILDFESANASFTPKAGPTWRYSSSNGVAVATDEKSARQRALSELIERDRLLRCFYGETRPERLDLAPSAFLPSRLAAHYDLAAYRFPAPKAGIELPPELGGPVTVAAVFGFPLRGEVPLLFGFGARATLEEAIASAARESLQQLAFGWGEPVPDAPPDPTPTPEFHLDHYAHPPNHSQLRVWLGGEHHGQGPRLPKHGGTPSFLDITPLSVRDKLWVIKSEHDGALPLVFGEGHPLLDALPDCMRVHPIA